MFSNNSSLYLYEIQHKDKINIDYMTHDISNHKRSNRLASDFGFALFLFLFLVQLMENDYLEILFHLCSKYKSLSFLKRRIYSYLFLDNWSSRHQISEVFAKVAIINIQIEAVESTSNNHMYEHSSMVFIYDYHASILETNYELLRSLKYHFR